MSFFADAVSDFVTDEPSTGSKPSASSQQYHSRMHSFDTEPLSAARTIKMPGFADSFWSSDYAGGLGILFQKLQQGVTENQQMLMIASMRADAEELYSERLGDIAPTIDRMTGGFTRDDGASVRKVSAHQIISCDCAKFLFPGLRRRSRRDGRGDEESPKDCLKYTRIGCQPLLPLVRRTCAASTKLSR
jgi:hypothetical protein